VYFDEPHLETKEIDLFPLVPFSLASSRSSYLKCSLLAFSTESAFSILAAFGGQAHFLHFKRSLPRGDDFSQEWTWTLAHSWNMHLFDAFGVFFKSFVLFAASCRFPPDQ
jgi:hypothetical protein